MPSEHDHEPPTAPEIERRLQFHRLQMIGVPLLLVAPVLALAGRLGDARERVEIVERGVGLAVEFPVRDHFEDWSRIEVTVANDTGAPLSGVRAEFARGLFDFLSRPVFHPGLERIDDDAYVVGLGDIAAGEAHSVVVDYLPNSYGRLAGVVRLRAGAFELAEIPISLVVLP
ncbi:hypothetical protein [Nannocystis pusilla]|uniref:DUF3426 domain-containing protein n=1 Tax=Nannocystis pusilla TaxID=889268 RepID=A0ABS7TYW7_9BACT|nr:hypothetical protein [Nannocystis pusilla]MBZ5713379.1 hypothetical protein [Nannocystis pusilla]